MKMKVQYMAVPFLLFATPHSWSLQIDVLPQFQLKYFNVLDDSCPVAARILEVRKFAHHRFESAGTASCVPAAGTKIVTITANCREEQCLTAEYLHYLQAYTFGCFSHLHNNQQTHGLPFLLPTTVTH